MSNSQRQRLMNKIGDVSSDVKIGSTPVKKAIKKSSTDSRYAKQKQKKNKKQCGSCSRSSGRKNK